MITANEIFKDYLRMRQNRHSYDAVFNALLPYIEHLLPTERETLNQMIATWERKNVTSQPANQPAASAPVASPNKTLNRSPVVRPITLPAAPVPTPGPEKTPDSTPPAGVPTQVSKNKQFCPACGKPNRFSDMYCFSCGELLVSARVYETRQIAPPAEEPRGQHSRFGPRSILILMIFGIPRTVKLKPEGDTIVGRSAKDSPLKPDIDLAQFDADSLGVSRKHIVLRRSSDNTLQVIDLKSRNFTYINGQRVLPSEIRILVDGDELRLGKLTMRVVFQHND